jgi:hypothetical protein
MDEHGDDDSGDHHGGRLEQARQQRQRSAEAEQIPPGARTRDARTTQPLGHRRSVLKRGGRDPGRQLTTRRSKPAMPTHVSAAAKPSSAP